MFLNFRKAAVVLLGAGLGAGVLLDAEEVGKEVPAKPLVAADFECWEEGTVMVAGGWSRYGDIGGFSWFFVVTEMVDGDEGKWRFRKIEDLEMPEYLRMRRMDDEAFLKAFGKEHEETGGEEYDFWNEKRDGAVYYHDNEEGGNELYHQPDVSIPKDLTIGSEFKSFEFEGRVAAYSKELKGPWGACEAVRLDAFQEAKEEDGEVYPPYRVEQWYGKGLSCVMMKTYLMDDGESDDEEEPAEMEEEEELGKLVEELRLMRVLRPDGKE
jgi:hypothetical protein